MESLPRSNSVRSWCATSVKALAVITCLGLAPAIAQAQNNALPFDRSYLLTGNYAVIGVDLQPQAADCTTWSSGCYAKGTITVTTCPTPAPPSPGPAPGSCIPAGADVLAAWMYWEALSSDPLTIPVARFNGSPLSARRNDLPLPSQGSCLSSSGSQLTASMFRADVFRLFPFQNNSSGRREVTGTYQIALPEVGNGNNARQGAGASLFFVYRLQTEPLRKVVVYDGAYLQPLGGVMRQTLQGFYQSWTDHQSAWITHIVGSGAKNTNEQLKFSAGSTAIDVVATDPFPFPLGNAGGNGSDRAWANPTYDVSNKMVQTTSLSGFGETASTAVDHLNNSPYECLTWAAVIFSTVVKDVDRDGLPDGLEDATAGLKDPSPTEPVDALTPVGRSLPNLNAMGARSQNADLTPHKDIFIEMNATWTRPGTTTTYGNADFPFSTILGITSVTDSVGHNHLPTPETLKRIGDAFKDAPTSIAAHFDVGPNYSAGVAAAYVITSGARGGELIEELPCDATKPGCHFPKFPGTVGWKFGFEHLRDQAVDEADGHELSPADADNCYEDGKYGSANGTSCRRRFDPIRNGLFHYFLYAHALGIPKGKPCLELTTDPDSPIDKDFNGPIVAPATVPTTCVSPYVNNPNYHVPRSTSGAGDAPGSGAVITLGLWDLVNFVGSAFVQASTTVHEFGHNVDLSHGGLPPKWGSGAAPTSFEANCKPNYPSIMSYLFQVNGLLDLAGNAHIDYSRGAYYDTNIGSTLNPILDEFHLNDGQLPLPDVAQPAAFRYRTAWFVPIEPGNLASMLGVQPATRYCNGVKFGSSAPSPSMGRFDGPLAAALLDWNLDGSTAAPPQDLNFDGASNGVFQGQNDWDALRLDQIGVGRNPGGFSLGQGGFEFGQGGFGFGQGGFEFGQGGFDFGQGGFEFGQGTFEFGQGGFDFGQGGFDFGDGGFSFGQGGFGFGQGGFDFGQGGFDFGQGGFDFGNDLDYDQIRRNGLTPPLSVTASVIQTAGTLFHRNRVVWTAPNVGTVSVYKVFRALGATIGNSSTVEQLCSVAGVPSNMPACTGATTFDDREELPYNQSFTYFVRAVFSNCNTQKETCQSGPSNFATVIAENTAPVAVNDPTGNNKWTVSPGQSSALVVLTNDTDVDSGAASRPNFRVLITVQPAHGTVEMVPGTTNIAKLAADGSVVYVPTPGYSGTDTFKYKADDGTWRTPTGPKMSDWSTNEATVTFTVKK